MGCAASRPGVAASPGYDASTSSRYTASGSLSASASIWTRPVRLGSDEDEEYQDRKPAAPQPPARRRVDGEQAAAGWPSWLSAVAAEAVQGWVPLRAEGFEKLEKVGQGTYSSVFRARELRTGRVVALKKVRFDSVEPESVRFMAREVVLLRRLQRHPNVVGLLGIVTSRSSRAVYLVFEYMEHDLAGLTSSPDVTFTEPQIKCYMRQLMEGLAHCHARGVMHRDIKCANLLVSNAGELKVADFGLATQFSTSSSSPSSATLTSRVVTLWYRPPELLLGSTAYGPAVDLWSAGCVFAELHARRPVLQGRTEVEQIHRIFKLCGSPPDEFWRRGGGGAHAAVFRPHQPYPSRLRDTFAAAMPDPAFRLLQTLLALDPDARGTAAAALDSDYFRTAPLACDPSTLPKYAPNKEMDAKIREDSTRRSNGRTHAGDAAKRGHNSMVLQDASQRHVHAEESLPPAARRDSGGEARLIVDLQPVAAISKRHDVEHHHHHARNSSYSFNGPAQLAASTGFAWAKKPRPDAAKRSASRCPRPNSGSNGEGATTTAPYEAEKQEMIRQWAQVAEAFSSSDAHNGRFRQTVDVKQLKTVKKHKGQMDRVDFSGPLLSQPRRIDELLENHEHQIRRAGPRSWFRRESKREQH
ncbi:hypothetical protein QOZ80_5AG0395240 [Eleusine coracana subsp. coracana]|nr:hypothetical protein QOZ80_5AG0395240 [Eleusine coracana subsp. coracana]